MKKLLNNYREYNDGIEILINKFESEFEESEELKTLKKQYKVQNNKRKVRKINGKLHKENI